MVITSTQLLAFGLVFIRMVVMILFAPVFSNKDFFSLGKFILLFWTSALTLFYIPLPIFFPDTPFTFLFAMLTEIMIGAMIGFIAQLFVSGLEFAGNLMDTQAGLSVASILDPSTGQTTTLLSKILKQVALLVFLLIDGHHIVLSALMKSFEIIPIGAPFRLAQSAEFVTNQGVQIFILGLQFAAPILLVVFLTDFGFGMLSRVAPQVNVFQLGFQLKPIISILVLLTIIPGMLDLIYYVLERLAGTMLEALFILRI